MYIYKYIHIPFINSLFSTDNNYFYHMSSNLKKKKNWTSGEKKVGDQAVVLSWETKKKVSPNQLVAEVL